MTGKPSEPSDRLSEPLSERELEILACLAEGLSNQEIANKLFLAEQTVRWYNSQIYSKMAVGNRKEAVARLQERLPCLLHARSGIDARRRLGKVVHVET